MDNGNILSLKRNGNIPEGETNALMDNLQYKYLHNPNRLGCVLDDPALSNKFTCDIDNQIDTSNYSSI